MHLERPGDPDRLLDAADVRDWNARDDYMPYWAYVWPGARLLARAVLEFPWDAEAVSGFAGESGGGCDADGSPIDRTALEIGCGVGLGGLAALAAGLPVVFTDYDETPLEFAAASARRNGFDERRWRVELLDWRKPPARRHPVILGADVLYEARLVPLVAELLSRTLARGGLALLAGPYRVATENLERELASRGLSAKAVPTSLDIAGPNGERPMRGTVHHVEWPDAPARLSRGGVGGS